MNYLNMFLGVISWGIATFCILAKLFNETYIDLEYIILLYLVFQLLAIGFFIDSKGERK